MKPTTRIMIAFGLLSLLSTRLPAQSTDSLEVPGDSLAPEIPLKTFLIAAGSDTLYLSDLPTVQELKRILVATGEGRLDPFLALPAAIGKGDAAVPSLDTVLFSDPIVEIIHRKVRIGGGGPDAGSTMDVADTVRLNRLFAAMALEAIGSRASYPVLLSAVQRHDDVDIRGMALRALAGTFHEGERLEKFIPDKELVHLLLVNVDDTTRVPYLQKSLGQIAREGLIAWLKQDFGEPQGKNRRLRDAKGGDRGSLAEYREEWWQLNASKISWDDPTRSFRVR